MSLEELSIDRESVFGQEMGRQPEFSRKEIDEFQLTREKESQRIFNELRENSKDQAENWCIRYIAESNLSYYRKVGSQQRPETLSWLIIGREDRMCGPNSPHRLSCRQTYSLSLAGLEVANALKRQWGFSYITDLVAVWGRGQVKDGIPRDPAGLIFTSAFPEREAFWNQYAEITLEFAFKYAYYKGVELQKDRGIFYAQK